MGWSGGLRYLGETGRGRALGGGGKVGDWGCEGLLGYAGGLGRGFGGRGNGLGHGGGGVWGVGGLKVLGDWGLGQVREQGEP